MATIKDLVNFVTFANGVAQLLKIHLTCIPIFVNIRSPADAFEIYPVKASFSF